MKRERVVLDTNVLISGLLSTTSTPAQAVERAIRDDQLLASTATLRELMTKLLSPTFDRFVPRERRDALLLRLAPSSKSWRSFSRFARLAIQTMASSSRPP